MTADCPFSIADLQKPDLAYRQSLIANHQSAIILHPRHTEEIGSLFHRVIGPLIYCGVGVSCQWLNGPVTQSLNGNRMARLRIR
jgi:hypothetical protein